MKIKTNKLYHLVAIITICFHSCSSLNTSRTSSGNSFSNPHYCKENTDADILFSEAVRWKRLKTMNELVDAGVDINGKTCNCKVVNTSAGQGKWRKIKICDEKPFFLEAMATNNIEVIQFFIEHGVIINQGYSIYEWEKDFGNFHTGNVKSALQITTLDELFRNSVSPEILELLLSKGAKVTPFVKYKTQKMNDSEILSILKKYGVEL